MCTVSIWGSAWSECDLQQQTDGPGQGYIYAEMAGALVSDHLKQKKKNVSLAFLEGDKH